MSEIYEACDFISQWNNDIQDADGYLRSPEGMKTLAATCMLIESLGEAIKKIDRHYPNFLMDKAPGFSWKELKGMRDHIAHGYFRIDAEIVFDVVKNEIPTLSAILKDLIGQF